MDAYETFEIYAKLSDAVYGIQEKSDHTYAIDRNVWEQLSVNVLMGDGSNVCTVKDENGNPYYYAASGMVAAAYRNINTGEIVIAYRGTEDGDVQDFAQDLVIASGNIPQNQFNDAYDFYQAITTQYENNVTLTGYSLGGALAQLVAAKAVNNIENPQICNTVTFNAPGMLNMLNQIECSNILNYSFITNYVIMNDYIGNFKAHVGNTYYIQPVPIENDPLRDTHCNILDYTKETLGEIFSKPIGFGTREALALWYYDVKNNNISIRSLIGTQVNADDLINAIDIINREIGMPINQLRYSTVDGEYIIGTPDNEDDWGDYEMAIVGSESLLGLGGNDIIWGNGGNDRIYGQSGNDILIGGAGQDTLYGGTGNDILIGDSTNYTIDQLKAIRTIVENDPASLNMADFEEYACAA